MTNGKRLLRFYFNADGLEGALNNLIINAACSSAYCVDGWEHYAERILAITEAKERLSELWQYIDGVISVLKCHEVQTLKGYALMRCGIKKLDPTKQREIKRVVTKFSRHARLLDRYAEGMRLVAEYYCLT